MIKDELLREALMLSLDETIASHKRASEGNPHRFSLAYKIRERSIIRFAERYEAEKAYTERNETEKPRTERRFMPLRRLALFMAIIAAAVVLSVGAYAAYLIINGFVFDVHGEYSDVTLDLSDYELKNAITELYWISPESGWDNIGEMTNGEIAVSDYQFNDNTIVITQYTKYAAEQSLKVNTEYANVHGVNINGNEGFVTIRHRKNQDEYKSVMWVMDGYIFDISGVTITEDELVRFAESVVVKEKFE